MAEAAIAAEIRQSFDRLLYLAPQVNFDLEIRIDDLADFYLIIGGQIVGLDSRIDVSLGENLVRRGAPNAIDIGERDFNAFVSRQLDTGYSCHRTILPLSPGRLALALLMARILTENADHALTAHHFAVLTNLLD